jgi:lipopolysaccharide biosynthesis glycosyltransferase
MYLFCPQNRYGQNVKIVHFIGTAKPWHVKFDIQGQAQPNVYEDNTSQFLQQWWSIFHSDVKPSMAKMVRFHSYYHRKFTRKITMSW